MNVALSSKPRMTREEFFAWAQIQGARYEFDGFQPVAMTGASVNHNHIVRNIHRALYARLRGSACLPLGPDEQCPLSAVSPQSSPPLWQGYRV